MVLFALGEGQRLPGALDHSFARSRFLALHLGSFPDLWTLAISARTLFKTRRSFGHAPVTTRR
jgi:hypothetical protein